MTLCKVCSNELIATCISCGDEQEKEDYEIITMEECHALVKELAYVHISIGNESCRQLVKRLINKTNFDPNEDRKRKGLI